MFMGEIWKVFKSPFRLFLFKDGSAQFSEEQEIINANKRLIEIMERKIEMVMSNLLY
jgi:hypothetical protein